MLIDFQERAGTVLRGRFPSLVSGLVLGGVLVVAPVALTGCGTCDSASVSMRPVQVSDPNAPLTLEATVRDGDQPMVGASVTFFVAATGAGAPEGRVIGSATADGNGVAKLDRDTGVYGMVSLGQTVTGVYAKPPSKLGKKEYCEAKAEVPVVCGTGPCQAKPTPG